MSEQRSANVQLKPCPFCSGIARFCGADDDPEPHECHQIICTGCGLSMDMTDSPEAETVQELRDIMAAKWNNRV